MTPAQLGYYCQDISITENPTYPGFYDISIDLSIMSIKLTCKEIEITSVDRKAPSPLEKWYKELLNKSEEELTILDISRMLRQNVKLETAIPAAMELLINDPFEGEMYEGELLKHLANALQKTTTDIDHAKLRAIIDKADSEKETYDWGLSENKEDYDKYLLEIKNIVRHEG